MPSFGSVPLSVCDGFAKLGLLTATAVAGRYVSVSILLAGFFVRFEALKIAPIRWLSFLSYPRFAIAGLSTLELEGINFYPTSASLAAGDA